MSQVSQFDPRNPADSMPRHVAIIMDGNGRWANLRGLPRPAGHREGVKSVQRVVKACRSRGIGALTLFAFSSENWQRPRKEVSLLMDLFISTLKREIENLHRNNVRIRFIGERSAFTPKLDKVMDDAEILTGGNQGLQLNIAANYGGHWDIVRAAQCLARKVEAGEISADAVDAQSLAAEMSLAGLPEPDLFIRTGGEQRISNFLLWQLAYTELYFTDVLWPDFDEDRLDEALAWFAGRQRRFGRTGEQVEQKKGA
jgi:undecaprenyl diphosphate synthase